MGCGEGLSTAASKCHRLFVTAKNTKKKRAENTKKKRAENAKTIRPSAVNIDYFSIELSVFALRSLSLCGEKNGECQKDSRQKTPDTRSLKQRLQKKEL